MPYPTLQDTDLILDTETTGLGDSVLELAIVDGLGRTLFDQRIRLARSSQRPLRSPQSSFLCPRAGLEVEGGDDSAGACADQEPQRRHGLPDD